MGISPVPYARDDGTMGISLVPSARDGSMGISLVPSERMGVWGLDLSPTGSEGHKCQLEGPR